MQRYIYGLYKGLPFVCALAVRSQLFSFADFHLLGTLATERGLMAPAASSTPDDSSASHLSQIDGLNTQIRALATQLVKKDQELVDLKVNLAEKETSLRSYSKANIDLKRKAQDLG